MFVEFTRWLTFQVFGLPPETRLAQAVQFFIYDSVKIIFLLFVLIFTIAVARSFIPHKTVRRWMTNRGVPGHIYAALFGAVTPFCSCSSIPLFISFLKNGAPLGIMFSFLITSPIINEYLVVLMLGFFGWKITAAYVLSGILIGVAAGLVLGKMRLEKYVETDFSGGKDSPADLGMDFPGLGDRVRYAWNEAAAVLKKIWVWVLVGVGVGAVIHNYVPDDAINAVVSSTGIFSVPLAVLVGIPMYGSCAAIVPIAVVLLQKGVPLGTALSFMMAIAALSLPEAVMLRRAMKLPLVLIFFAVTTAAIIVTGYLFNALQHVLI